MTMTKKDMFESQAQKEQCEAILNKLTNEEKEQAALSSYAYATSTPPPEDHDQQRSQAASAMIRRHYVACKQNTDKTLESLKATLEFRKQRRVNEIRTCFSSASSSTSNDDDKDNKKVNDDDSYLETIRQSILKDALPHPKMLVRGFDKEGRPTLVKFQNSKFELMDEDTFLNVQIYWIERAIAISEKNGQQEKINMATDYTGYARENKPPMSLLRKLIGMLQTHYPERLHLWIACDPTFILRTVWSIASLFVDPVTKEKVIFVTGPDQKQERIGKHFGNDQAMPFLLPDGQLDPVTEAGVKEFLYNIRLDCTYDGH